MITKYRSSHEEYEIFENEKIKSKCKIIYLVSSLLFVITVRLMDLVILEGKTFNKEIEIKCMFILALASLIVLIKQSYSICKKI